MLAANKVQDTIPSASKMDTNTVVGVGAQIIIHVEIISTTAGRKMMVLLIVILCTKVRSRQW